MSRPAFLESFLRRITEMTGRGADVHRVGNGSFGTEIHPSRCENLPICHTTTHCLSHPVILAFHLFTTGLFPTVNNSAESKIFSLKNPRLYW
jgi:hypothetical protein